MPKTLAIKLSDELHATAAAVASLEGISLTELIRTSIENHLDAKRDSGELASKAQAVLDDIEREAEVRREAIAGLLGNGTAKGADDEDDSEEPDKPAAPAKRARKASA